MDTNLPHAHLLPKVAKQIETVLSALPPHTPFPPFNGIVYFEVGYSLLL